MHLVKKDSTPKKPMGFGNTSRRFTQSERRQKGEIARDLFAFDQAMQGHDCQKIRADGDFIVQKRDFFGNKVGEPTTFEVKVGNSKLTEAQEQRQRRMGRNRYKVTRY
jgi:hypothetical protein